LDSCSATGQHWVGVVVVNWNGWQNTLKTYESLAASNYKNWTLLIVDNASSDESAAMIRQHLSDAVLIESKVNLGFAGGCNLGIARCMALNFDYIFLLNSDATVTADTLAELVSASSALNDNAALGSLVRYWPSGQLQFFGSERSKQSGRPCWYSESSNAELLSSAMIETDFIFGAALFVPIEVLEKVGTFDERFFLNYEETDWCYRAAIAGVPRYVVTHSVVYHQGSASLGELHAPLQTYFLTRNRLLLCDKHGSLRHRLRGYLEAVRSFALALRGDVSGTSSVRISPSTAALLLAIRDYIFRRFGDCPAEVRRLARKAAAIARTEPMEVPEPDGHPRWL
jgi:GT2 family glycosyltransferase